MKKPPIIVFNVVLFTVLTLISVIGVPYWALTYGFNTFEIVTTVVLFFFTGMSITAGYHRLWSHKAYEANALVKFVLAVGGAMTLQNSILHWASDHRVHHRHVDVNDKDPYSAKRGFWFSHIGWMLREYQAERYTDYSNCRDLQKDKIVMWQHNYYVPIVLVSNIAITALLGYLNGSVLGMMLLAGICRIVLVHHVTFFINSLCHIWGKQPYTDCNTAKDNGILALFTFGEGYHNYHHIFEYDYRNGIKWWHYDPTKWVIKALSLIGWTKNLRKCPEDKIQQAKFAMQLQFAKEKLEHRYPNPEEVIAKLEAEYELLVAKCNEYYLSKKRLMRIQQRQLKRTVDSIDMHTKCEELKAAFQAQKLRFNSLISMPLQPA